MAPCRGAGHPGFLLAVGMLPADAPCKKSHREIIGASPLAFTSTHLCGRSFIHDRYRLVYEMDFEWPDELKALCHEAETFALDVTRDSAFPEDSWILGFDRQVSLELGRRGWIGMTWPVKYGGHERTALERFVVSEQLIRHGAPISASWFADRQIGPSILTYGSESQKQRWIPDMAAGRSMWCIGMSEPSAGSDVSAISTRAIEVNDAWTVTGQKLWTSGAAEADWCYCIARTEVAGAPHAGLSDLVIDMRSPGITVGAHQGYDWQSALL